MPLRSFGILSTYPDNRAGLRTLARLANGLASMAADVGVVRVSDGPRRRAPVSSRAGQRLVGIRTAATELLNQRDVAVNPA